MEHSYNDTRGPSAWYKMKTRPKHLPSDKQQRLQHIVEMIRARHDVEMVILFGSHARGDWVEDEYEEDHITYEYRSDYDILVVTEDKNSERLVAYDGELRHELEPGGQGNRVNPIVHTIHHVNQMLAERRFFFMDILKEGYLLYDSGRYRLARPPKELSPKLMYKHAKEYYEDWMESADGFMRGAEFHQSEGRPKIAAFDLHQSAERYITCLLLVHTGYRPKEHDMEKLISQAAGFDGRYATVFPQNSKEEQRLFDLLRRAYVDARYSKSYRISDDELNAIAERIEQLKAVTEDACTQRIEALRKAMETENSVKSKV